MLRRTVTEEGKDWDRLLPYLLFAYREVPQASTGFSPFELLYGRAVRGPLDVIKATWKADERSNESVVSYVLCIQDRLTKMAELVKDNLEKAQETQKKCYLVEDVGGKEELHLWNEEEEKSYEIADQLTDEQRVELRHLLEQYKDTLQDKPGRTLHGSGARNRYSYCKTGETTTLQTTSKKDGGIRFCVDYRRLNAVSAADCYPMPRVDELIDRLGTAKYISTLDLSRGYWQVPMSAESRKKTSFVTPVRIQCDAVWTTWRTIYLSTDDGPSVARPNPASATSFGMDECTYLGHIVGNGHVRPEKGKVAAVEAFPVPKTKKDVRAFLGLTGYYRKFIPEYATIAALLTELTKKEQPNCLAWSSGCAEAFEALKRHLCTSPVLKCPNFERPFVLQTDASDWGVGAVLSQKDDDDNEHPVAYFSKKLLPRERRYSTIEKECLAIKLATHAFRVYLLGKPFTVQTDHHALEWLDRLKEDNARLTRWCLALQPYQFKVKYRPGKLNGNADALSRQASLSPEEG
eukprot:Em0002g608a